MTVAARFAGMRQASPGRHRSAMAPASAARSRLPVSLVALSAATGVLVAAAAYTAGRLGHASSPWADRAYWLGQALILVPAAVRFLSRRALTDAEAVTVVIVLTVAEYLVKICYSPAAFTYVDELEHWRSTVDILHTGRLFSVNYLLPISAYYPGLEEVTAALVSVTGLSPFTCGVIVAGVAHLLFVCLLYLFFRSVSHSHRLAGIALLCYASNSHFQSFDSMFAYQTLALSFFGLAVAAAWRLSSPQTAGKRAGWVTVAVLAIAATVVTHHITSYMLVATLVVVTLASLISGSWRSAGWPAAMALLSIVAVVGWVVFAAPETVTYLQPTAEAVLQAFRTFFGGGHSSGPSLSAGPLGNRALSGMAVLTVTVLLPVGWWLVWRHHRRDSWTLAMAIGSVGWFGLVAIRLAVANGSQLSGRAATFIFIPVSYVVAVAVAHLIGAAVRWQARVAAAAAMMLVLLLMFDGLANGWPPYWERLPGPHQVAGFERSVGPEEIAAAEWALATLGPGNRFATDFGSYPVLGSYGYQDPVRDDAYLYTSRVFTPADASKASAQSIRYVLVDRRLSQALPVTGQYFRVDPNAGKYTHPLPLADLEKFNHIPGVDRVYDAGNIVIYELAGAAYAP